MSTCEWDPKRNRPAQRVMEYGKTLHWGCENEATLSVGAGKNNWHLCARCAALPEFKRLRRRVPLMTLEQEP